MHINKIGGVVHMVIDMNYWGKVFKNIVIVLITIIGIYLSF